MKKMQSSNSTTLDAMQLAEQYKAAGRLGEAEAALRQILAAAPNYHPAYHTLGLIAYEVGQLPLALELIAQAIALDPGVALYLRNAGEMYRRLGRLPEAVAAGKRACALAPKDLDAHYNLGLALSDQGVWAEAIKAYRRALKLNPAHGLSWNNLGAALEQHGRLAEAEAAYARAVALNPAHHEAQNNLGAMYSTQGRLEDACRCFDAAIQAAPDFIEPHFNLSTLKTYREDDPHLLYLERNQERTSAMPEAARIRYWFALGKAREDVGRYDAAFAAYAAGNRLQHALLPCDEPREDALLEQIRAVFSREFFAARQAVQGYVQNAGKAPIFIVGMPRSGTTLLEQILSSHPAVYGAGELSDLNLVIMSAARSDAQDFPNFVPGLLPDVFARLGEAYAARVWKLAPQVLRITDKMPANFFYLGMIHLMLPHAKIIHSMRDPMDSCFSNFARLFTDTMEFTYDLGTLGRYYTRYIQLMQHWHAVLPADTILDLRYEDLVTDTEGQARRILDFVGLPWDDNCLAFHQNKRHVKTASVAQVRKPIYQTSVARWQRFAPHLMPLLECVQAYRDTDAPTPTLEARCAYLQNQGAHAAALALLDAADAHGEGTAQSAHLRGISLYKTGHLQAAQESYAQALRLQVDFPLALNSMGFVLQDLGRIEAARDCFAKAIALDPHLGMARLNLGMAQLKLGEWQAGWQNYEARWVGAAESANGGFSRPHCPLPQWSGEQDTQAQHLLVFVEQGFGDTFLFARYLWLALQRFAKVGFVCSAPTQRLLAWSFGDRLQLLPQIPMDFSTWHWQCPMMSLPLAFGSRPENVPASLPYLTVPTQALEKWQARLAQIGGAKPRIGIAWAGRKTHQFDARRSLPFAQLLPLLRDTRFSWISLQKWGDGSDQPMLTADIMLFDWTAELADFADTAALVSTLDLVITIDSSMAHLAGALNKPVWMMNRFDGEWRWLQGRSDSAWYPCMRIFNQPAFGDWPSVLQAVGDALQGWHAGAAADCKNQAVTASFSPTAPTMPGDFVPEAQAQPLSLDQAMALATQHHAIGQLVQAEHWLRQVLQVQAQHAQALHLLGVIAHQSDKPEMAIGLIQSAIASNGQVALFHANLGEMWRQRGQIEIAIAQGKQAVALDASLASAHSNLGIAYFDRKDYAQAEICQQRALALDPQFAQALNNMGSICRANKDQKTALDWYRRACAANSVYLEPLSNLGAVLLEEDRAQEALAPLLQALRINPNYAEALCNLGMTHNALEQYDMALPLLQRALQLRPNYPEALASLARVYYEQEHFSAAELYARRCAELASENSDLLSQLGSIYTEIALSSEAESMYRCALAIEPARSDALLGLGHLSLEQGDIDEAENLLQQALENDSDNLAVRFHLTQIRKVKAGDANLRALEAAEIAARSAAQPLPVKKATALHFALGKCYDDSGEYAKAFPHFLEGCRLKRGTFHYDATEATQHFESILQVFDDATLTRLRGGDASQVPIFVLGMPRSGTTLTEQIIASHPDVYGAGELPDLLAICNRVVADASYPLNMQAMDRTRLSAWGADYVAGLRKRAPGARHITDKMPANFYALGLIHLMLPNAKIIHVQRNPVDTCLSCFTRFFNRKQESTYDLAELGRYYVDYARLMAHWRKVLPAGAFLEVQYEAIVANQEAQARRMLDFCGLAWNDACLDFHKHKRAIRTASVAQVRQPIYSTSVERWRLYEPFLGPLLEALGDLVPR